ncbi:hypothetical protein [Actinoplanes couchii]|uniref:Uncharacterized protein n=1 Tax=Actinoplanes couchii TaxID=403638 RepID=A0ABQ3XDF7_9ACTN|nr:hypothetical protein [Actinoplanes couchii]MDR6321396.1 hypothetical protein [Actinoplanes couchii]GID56506.1 hypothetical protein Aco03nite_049100 [Actinoplanes couchii]
MPFALDEVYGDLACGKDPVTGRWRGWYTWHVDSDALRRLGLHPGQETSQLTGVIPASWWPSLTYRRFRARFAALAPEKPVGYRWLTAGEAAAGADANPVDSAQVDADMLT